MTNSKKQDKKVDAALEEMQENNEFYTEEFKKISEETRIWFNNLLDRTEHFSTSQSWALFGVLSTSILAQIKSKYREDFQKANLTALQACEPDLDKARKNKI